MQGKANTVDPFKLAFNFTMVTGEQQKGIALSTALVGLFQLRLLRNLYFTATGKKTSPFHPPLFNTEFDLFEKEYTGSECNRRLARIGGEHAKQMDYVFTSVNPKDYVGFKYAYNHCDGGINPALLSNQLSKSCTKSSWIAY